MPKKPLLKGGLAVTPGFANQLPVGPLPPLAYSQSPGSTVNPMSRPAPKGGMPPALFTTVKGPKVYRKAQKRRP